MRVRHLRSGRTLACNVEMADSSWRRAKGLLGRPALDRCTGLWITPSSGIHTVGMRFPIDVIGLDAQGKVIRLWKSIPPQRATALVLRMRSALELSAGSIEQTGIQTGDVLFLEDDDQGANEFLCDRCGR
ncbi:MAG: DUF192 domain-containing protein [Acidobacteriaceae bacterium]|nr:DUF192 domain-containing protein [Acidobacteriaceae bacterium]